MTTRKDYRTAPEPDAIRLVAESGRSWMLEAKGTQIDFRRWLHLGRPVLDGGGLPVATVSYAERDDLVSLLKEAVWEIKDGGTTEATILNLCSSGLRYWFLFLDELHTKGVRVSDVKQITQSHLSRYISWLNKRPALGKGGKLSYTSTKAIYSATKSVLLQICRMGMLNISIFPLNPFPSVERAYRGQDSLSKGEMEKVMAGLTKDILEIRDQTFDGGHEEMLAVCFLMISARSGRNLTPLLEMTVDCIQPHPLREDMCILQVYKRRGYKKSVMAFQTEGADEASSSVPTDVDQLVQLVLSMTEELRKLAPANINDCLWLTKTDGPENVGLLKASVLSRCIANFVKRHGLTTDHAQWDGSLKAMTLNVSRFRKTFGQRIWELSGGNLLRTANLLGNLPRITDSHYLAVTPEMERNHKFVGTILHATFEGINDTTVFKEKLATQMNVPIDRVETILNGKANTGVGRCSDFHFGRFSPRNGKDVCTRFLHCFRCPNQVVMESDLHRLFSFYWLLLRERVIMGRTQWKKVYSWVIREIDTSISSNFDHNVVAREKERARTDPHPMWKDRGMLGVGIQ